MSLVVENVLLHCSGFAKLLNALDIKLVKVVKYNLVEMPQGSVVESPQIFYKRPVPTLILSAIRVDKATNADLLNAG